MVRRPLGRGLGALLESSRDPEGERSAGFSAGAPACLMVAVDRIAPSPFQPRRRFDPERLQELTRAIQTQGVIEPLVVRPLAAFNADGAAYELIAGERRLRAARDAGLTAVPVVVREVDERAALEMSLVENLAREELSPIEEARAFVQLSKEFALSHEQIADRIGKSRPYVSNIIRLLDLPAPVIEMIERNELTAGQARPLLALADEHARIAAARRIASAGISARGAERLASAARRVKGGSAAPVPDHGGTDPNLQALENELRRALKRKVRIVPRRGATPGRIEIDYYDERDLTALWSTLTRRGDGREASAAPDAAASTLRE